MFKRVLMLFILVFGFFVTGVSAQCVFDNLDSSCESFSSPFNSFNLNFDSVSNLESYEVSLFLKSNPSNELKTRVEGNLVFNVNPFVEAGVYVLRVSSKNKAGVIVENDFEFVFDNSKPAAPIVDLNLVSNTNSILVMGKGRFGMSVLAEDLNGQSVTSVVDSNGDFQINLNLNSGLNYFRFYQVNSNGIKSEPIERIILFDDGNIVTSDASGIVVDDLSVSNMRTYLDVNSYVTTKRNFYVSGKVEEALRGSDVYVNGVKAKVDGLNRFGAFVLLNEGSNKLKIQSGALVSFVDVTYVEPRFKFLNLNFTKVTNVDSFSLSGKVNYDVPFDVYVNGKFVSQIISTNGNFDEVISGLNVGKNYIYLSGLNGEGVREIVYYDNSLPQVVLSGSEKLAYSNKLVFEILDDTGVDISQLKLIIGPYVFTSDSFNVSGDFYMVDVSSVEDGSYNYVISAVDRTGNLGELSGVLSIDKSNTLFESFNVESGYVLGNNIFTKKGVKKLSLSPSRYVAFEEIYLDGVRQSNYEIKSNGDVELLADFENSNGVLEMKYINSNHDSFSEIFNYYTDDEEPFVDLDYVAEGYSIDSGLIKISGEIVDSHFDWTTLNFNGVSNYLRFGSYFEAFVPVASSNLEISGRDYSLNEISNKVFGGIFTKDIRDTSVTFNKYSKDSVIGVLSNTNSEIKNYVTKYDGEFVNKVYLSNNFELGVSEREGLRSVNFKGVESSLRSFKSYDVVSVDASKPEIYFIGGANSRVKIVVDGTLSDVEGSSLSILDNGISVSSISNCDVKVGVFSKCYDVPSGSLEVSVSDVSGNSNSKVFSGSFDSLPVKSTSVDFFFNGNDKVTTESIYFVSGNVIGGDVLTGISVNGKACEFDDVSFVCSVNLNLGANDFEVVVKNSLGADIVKSYSIDRKDSNLVVSLDGAKGYGVFKSGSQYFINLNLIDVWGNVNSKSLVKVLVDGNEIRYGNKVNGFNLSVDLGENVFGKSYESIDLWVEAEDEFGNKGVSNKFKLVYNRVLQTILKVIVG